MSYYLYWLRTYLSSYHTSYHRLSKCCMLCLFLVDVWAIMIQSCQWHLLFFLCQPQVRGQETVVLLHLEELLLLAAQFWMRTFSQTFSQSLTCRGHLFSDSDLWSVILLNNVNNRSQKSGGVTGARQIVLPCSLSSCHYQHWSRT